ncbi:MAG: HD domain-containing protein [Verrucomicrobiaceae bacterium]|nr:MAG: HD domain-containing protein [Verrucomicrobiaceae bacterium]
MVERFWPRATSSQSGCQVGGSWGCLIYPRFRHMPAAPPVPEAVQTAKQHGEMHAAGSGTSSAKTDVMIASDALSILQTATDMAARAHIGQSIRDTEIPYIAHPMRVSLLVQNIFGCRDEEVAAACLLHDTLEKTGLTAEAIQQELGPRVLHLVRALTKQPEGNRRGYWKMLRAEVWEARLIKMADALDHLDCPPEDLARRVRSAGRALELAHSGEEPIVTARQVLQDAMEAASSRARQLF